MGRAPCCSKVGLHRGPWTPREDTLLTKYIQAHGEGQWKSLPKKAGLLRCGKSCRLRWMNYLRPDIKRGNIAPEEDDLIIRMHSLLGNKWSLIAGRLPGRTDNEIKNYWNTHLSKKMKNPGFLDSKDEAEEERGGGPAAVTAAKKKNNDGGKKKNKNNKREKNNKKSKGSKEEESTKTQVYLPKPIRVKPSSLARTNSTSFTTLDSNNSATTTSQEKEEEDNITKLWEETNKVMFCDEEFGGNNNNLDENDGFGGFYFDGHEDLVINNNSNNSDMECQSYDYYYAKEDLNNHHGGTLEKLYEEYLQVLNMEDNMYELDSFAESLMV